MTLLTVYGIDGQPDRLVAVPQDTPDYRLKAVIAVVVAGGRPEYCEWTHTWAMEEKPIDPANIPADALVVA